MGLTQNLIKMEHVLATTKTAEKEVQMFDMEFC